MILGQGLIYRGGHWAERPALSYPPPAPLILMSSPVVATVKTLRSADGTPIHAEAVGNPRNPHVVFVHEMMLCSGVFDELVGDRRLTDHLYLVSDLDLRSDSVLNYTASQVRYDLRCHGKSGVGHGEEGLHPTRHADDFRAVVTAFGVQRPIVVAWCVLTSSFTPPSDSKSHRGLGGKSLRPD